MAAVRIGELIAGKYRVERVLGTGGMGVVVAARDTERDALFAIKVMHPEPGSQASWTARFRREAHVGGRLHGEHAVQVHDVGGFDEGRPYLVMELLEGTDLGKVLRRRGALPIEEAARYVSEACEALIEAHDLGFVHRDLKPANLFLARRADGSSILKVLDFGISKAALASGDALAVTQAGEVLGSPAYMAPEQIRAFHKVDPRSDVWALGVILYELVTGRWPFPGKASIEMIAMVLEREPDRASLHRAGLPPGLEELFARCFAKDPTHRVQSVRELRDALVPFLAPEGDPLATDDGPTFVSPPRDAATAPPPATSTAPITELPPILPAPPREGPSSRVVAVVAATSLALIVSTFVVLVRRAAPATHEATTAPIPAEAPVDGARARPAGRDAADDSAAQPVASTAPAVESAAPSTSAPAAEPATPPAERAAPAPARIGAIDRPAKETRDPSAPPGVFDQVAATRALASAAGAARRCKRAGGPTGAGRVEVSFAPSGQPQSVRVGAPFDGTPVGKCIAGAFRGISVPAFIGSTFAASKTVTIK